MNDVDIAMERICAELSVMDASIYVLETMAKYTSVELARIRRARETCEKELEQAGKENAHV